jgi:cytochrome P450
MDDGSIEFKEAAAVEAWATPIEALNPAQADLFAADAMWPLFERLRKEAPVHWTPRGDVYDGFWSISRYHDIMAVDINHEVFSSADGIALQTLEAKGEAEKRPRGSSFIAMDPPGHDVQRKAVSPAVAPANLQVMSPLIRERAGAILDALPIGEQGRTAGRTRGRRVQGAAPHTTRSTSIFFTSAMALAGFRPFGHTWAQFMIVWQR